MDFLDVITAFAMGYFLHWFKWLVMDDGIDKQLDSLDEE